MIKVLALTVCFVLHGHFLHSEVMPFSVRLTATMNVCGTVLSFSKTSIHVTETSTRRTHSSLPEYSVLRLLEHGMDISSPPDCMSGVVLLAGVKSKKLPLSSILVLTL